MTGKKASDNKRKKKKKMGKSRIPIFFKKKKIIES